MYEECGIVCVVGEKEASHYAYLGMYALQHREVKMDVVLLA